MDNNKRASRKENKKKKKQRKQRNIQLCKKEMRRLKELRTNQKYWP